MTYGFRYPSPLGGILIAADDIGLTELRFESGKYSSGLSAKTTESGEAAPIKEARRWLDVYFRGKNPDFTPPLHLVCTEFRLCVWRLLLKIPYGTTVTYGDLACRLAAESGIVRMSAQAIGGAVGHNPVSIIVPCHRVVGADGSLTGYAGGLDKKRALLESEGVRVRPLSEKERSPFRFSDGRN